LLLPLSTLRINPARFASRRQILVVPQEQQTLEALDTLLQLDVLRTRIDAVVERVEKNLAQNPAAAMAWEPVPLSIYGDSLPSFVRSSWVFILRAGATTGAERHPNSHQRMMSYRGSGDLQTGGLENWQPNLLISDRSATWRQRWVTIPPNVWHQAVVGVTDWVVVSFQTASAEELIEERPDAADPRRTQQRKYIEVPK
jgi:hypothetical protein